MIADLAPIDLALMASAWLILCNIASYLAFAWDKHAAKNDFGRIPERWLLILAFLGGSIAAKLAQRRLRHKTRKQPFGKLLNTIILCQVAIIALTIFPSVRTIVSSLLSAFVG